MNIYRAIVSRMIEEVAGFPPNADDVDEVMTAIGELDGVDLYSLISKAGPIATSYGRRLAIERDCANAIGACMDNQFLQRRKM